MIPRLIEVFLKEDGQKLKAAWELFLIPVDPYDAQTEDLEKLRKEGFKFWNEPGQSNYEDDRDTVGYDPKHWKPMPGKGTAGHGVFVTTTLSKGYTAKDVWFSPESPEAEIISQGLASSTGKAGDMDDLVNPVDGEQAWKELGFDQSLGVDFDLGPGASFVDVRHRGVPKDDREIPDKGRWKPAEPDAEDDDLDAPWTHDEGEPAKS